MACTRFRTSHRPSVRRGVGTRILNWRETRVCWRTRTPCAEREHFGAKWKLNVEFFTRDGSVRPLVGPRGQRVQGPIRIQNKGKFDEKGDTFFRVGGGGVREKR